MSFIPTPDIRSFSERLAEWYDISDELKKLKAKEIMIRKALFGEAFPTPIEGTNKYPLGGGFELRARLDYDRKVDIAQLGHMRLALQNINVAIDPLLRWKAEINLRPYKALTLQARELFDNIVTTTPGTPQFEIAAANDVEETPAFDLQASPPVAELNAVEIPNEVPAKKKRRSRKATADV